MQQVRDAPPTYPLLPVILLPRLAPPIFISSPDFTLDDVNFDLSQTEALLEVVFAVNDIIDDLITEILANVSQYNDRLDDTDEVH